MGRKHLFHSVSYITLTGVMLCVFSSRGQIAKGTSKFLGNITTRGQVRSDFIDYWDQITGENEHKWSSVEGSRDRMNWRSADAIANFARENNIPWKFHTLVWGSQYPNWMNNLSTNEQREEIIEWFDACAERYPDVQMIDVVNEAYMSDPNNWNAGKHAPVPFREAIGGIGETGFDWIVESFKMARERWPDAILIYNDYNTLEWDNEIRWIKRIIPKLVAAGAPIDAVGFQAHGLKGTTAQTLKSRLDDIYSSIQMPMLISEYDIGENNDQAQLQNYQAHIPVMWEHPKVVGITVWGYILGATWVNGTGIKRDDGTERPALTWLKQYIKENPNPPNDYPDFLQGGGSNYSLVVSTKGRGDVTRSPDESNYEKDTEVILTATPSEGWVFESWSGDASGNQNPVIVNMVASKKITATFLTEYGTEDLVQNGSFSSGSDLWTFNNWSGEGTGNADGGQYSITVNSVGENSHDIQVVQAGITLEQGKTYRLIYDAYASSDRVMDVNVAMPEEPYTTFLSDIIEGEKKVNLSSSMQTFVIDFTMSESTYDNSRIEFSAGTDTPTVFIDNVSLYEIEASSSNPLKTNNLKTKNMIVSQKGNRIFVKVQNANNRSVSIEMYDLKGNVVLSENNIMSKVADNVCSFDVTNMPEGYYVLKLRNGNYIMKSGLMLIGK